jgi:hypothetical protein
VSSKLLYIDKEVFDKQRFYNLCKQYIGRESKDLICLWIKVTVIFAILAVFAGMIGFGFIVTPFGNTANSIFTIILYFAIVSKALNAFSEYRDKEQAIAWMMLPGSILEKFLSRLLITSALLFVAIYISFFIGINVGNVITALIWQNNFYLYIPFYESPVLQSMIIVLNFHAIFFAGGLYFKKHPFIKTCLAVAVIALGITAVLSAFGGLAYAVRTSYSGDTYYMMNRYWPEFAGRAIKLLFYCIIPIFCWIISYYRLREKQML